MRFRGTLRSISNVKGLAIWLNQRHVLLKQFGAVAHALSQELVAHGRSQADAQGRPFEYLLSWRTRKEDRARAIRARDGIDEGLSAVFECVENCRSFRVRGNRATRRLELVPAERRCAHRYFYYWDHDFGLMQVRIQTWLPFTIQIGINGREWRAPQLRRADIRPTQIDNCVFDVTDLAVAQQLLRQLETRPWARVPRCFATRVNPLLRGHPLHPYDWSLEESEYATDLVFRDAASLTAIYPALVTHAVHHFRTPDVLRLLGRPNLPWRVEVMTRVQRRSEGVRVKHWVAENSVKMSDKCGRILRVETTLNRPRRFRVYRATAPGTPRKWIALRKGIADMPRRVVISRAINARYLDALSVVPIAAPLAHLLDPVSHRRIINGRPYRALRPIAPDESACLARLLDGRAFVDGIRASYLRDVLTPSHATAADQRRLTGRVSRLLRLYRAHELLAKVAHTRTYRVTTKGHRVIAAALACRAAHVDRLVA